VDLSKVGAREVLKGRREPYWQRIHPGCFLGYRPSAREGRGTWIARAYDGESRKYRLKALGAFPDMAPRDQFQEAKKEAEAFAELISSGGHARIKIETVAQACFAFGKDKPEAEDRFRRHVYSDLIAKVPLAKLRRRHTEDWRARMEAKPALVSRRKKGRVTTRPRSPSTVNRDMAVLRAALGRVLAPGRPNTDAAWQEPLRPIKNATKRRNIYLDKEQRRALLAEVEPEVAAFVRALCLLPLRPGAVAALLARDFDKRTAELAIRKDKNDKPRRIVIPAAAMVLFVEQAQGKLPSAPLFMRSNGKAWDKESWKKTIAKAAEKAGLPVGTTAYALRHSTITDLIVAGLPLLTVAQISGTSAEMIERHYGHLSRSAATEALEGLAL